MNPDIVPVGFAAVEGEAALLRRRRNPFLLLALVVLVACGVGGISVAIIGFSGAASSVEDDAVARGIVAALDGPSTPAAVFVVATPGEHTVWMRTTGVTGGDDSDDVVAATNCSARFADGTSSTFRGAIQGASVTLGELSTVGTFTPPAGAVAVTCRHAAFGKRRGYDRFRQEREFLIVPGAPSDGWWPWMVLAGSIVAIALAVPVGSRWWRGRVQASERAVA